MVYFSPVSMDTCIQRCRSSTVIGKSVLGEKIQVFLEETAQLQLAPTVQIPTSMCTCMYVYTIHIEILSINVIFFYMYNSWI